MTTITVKQSRKVATPAALAKAEAKLLQQQEAAAAEETAKAEAAAKAAALKPKADEIVESCPIKARMLNGAIDKMASRNRGIPMDEVKDFSVQLQKYGIENLTPVLVTLGQNDPATTLNTIRRLIRQLTRDTYNRFDGIRKQQEQAARGNRNGGNANGHFLTTLEIIQHAEFKLDGETGRSQVVMRNDEDGVTIVTMVEEMQSDDPSYCSPVVQQQALEELYVGLAAIFLKLEAVEFAWREDFKSTGLPYYSYQDMNQVWRECITFEEACDRMAREREDFVIEKKAQKRLAIAAVMDMDLSMLTAKTRKSA